MVTNFFNLREIKNFFKQSLIKEVSAGLTNQLFSENIKIIELFTNANTQPHYLLLFS